MGKRILVADDDLVFQAVVAHGLRAAGYDVVVATNGLEALERVREDPPDVILLDLIMPKLDGTRACKILKRHPRHHPIPIILLTDLGPVERKTTDEPGAEILIAKREADVTLLEILGTLHRLDAADGRPRPQTEVFRGLRPRRIISELLAERQHAQTLLDTLGEGAIELDEREQVIYANPAALRILGRPEEEILATPGADLLGGANAAALQEALREVHSGGPGRTARLTVSRWSMTIGMSLTALPRPEGPPGALMVLQDLTEVARQTRNLRGLTEVSQILLGTLDLSTILTNIVARTAALLGANRCALWRVETAGAQYRLRCSEALGLTPRFVEEACLADGEGVAGTALARRQPVSTPDLVRDPAIPLSEPARLLIQGEDIEAALAAPVLLGEEAYGALAVYRASGRPAFGAGDVELLASLAASAALAIQSARLYREQVERATRLSIMGEIAQAVSSTLELDTLFQVIVAQVRRAIPCVRVSLAVPDAAGAGYRVAAVYPADRPTAVGAGAHVALADGPIAEALRTRRLVRTNDTRTGSQPTLAALAREGVLSSVHLPIVAGETCLGILNLGQDRPDAFADGHQELLQSLTPHLAAALRNARTYAEAERRRRQLEAVRTVTAEVIRELDLRALLQLINRRAGDLVGAGSGLVCLWDEAAQVLVPHAWYGPGIGNWMREARFPLGEGVIGTVAERRKGLIVNDYAAWPKASPTFLRHQQPTAVIGAPLACHGRLLGAFTIDNVGTGRPFTERDLEVLTLFADTAALAIENARLYAEAKDARDFLQSLAANSADAIVTTDVHGRCTYASPGIEAVFGYRPEEVLGQPVTAYYRSGPDEARAVMRRLRAEGRIRNYETAFRAKDGRYVEVSMSVSLLRAAGGAIVGTLGVNRDITERKRAEEQLHQSEKLATMGELLAGVAHELNNPLSVVMGLATLLGMAAPEGPVADRVKRIIDAVERCARIVKNFLALARQRPPELQRVLLNRIVQEAVEMLGYQIRVDSIAVALDLAEDVPVLWADPHQLQQVLVNLMTNAHHALRATPPPRRLTLTTRFDPVPQHVTLAVADSGPGIPQAIQARIFEPFFTTKPQGVGTGLGLSLSQGIIEGHGGTIEVESQPGQGAVFRIVLPVVEPPPAEATARSVEALPPIRGKSILVVEDEPCIAELLGEILLVDGHHVETAANGAEALARLQEKTYDLILSDIRMPEMDGPRFYGEVERRYPTLARRVLFLTGDALNAETREFLDRTRTPNLLKPFTLETARRAVQRALRR